MELKDVVSVAGKPGLHKIIGKGTSGLVTESLDGTAKRSLTPVTQKVSILEDVSVYTEDGDIKLAEVFIKMENLEKDEKLGNISKDSSPDAVKEWFASVVPDFNREKVYNSDILKIFGWYQMLKGKVDFNAKPEIEDKEKASGKSNSIKPLKKVEAKQKTSKGAAKLRLQAEK